jgi:hypothetical protein
MTRLGKPLPEQALRLSSLARHQRLAGLTFEDLVTQVRRKRAISDGELLQLNALRQRAEKPGAVAR